MTSTPWSRFVMPFQYAPSDTGAPVPGSKLAFYASGTSTPLATYSDAALTIANLNPVKANQFGIFGDIFLQTLSYKVVWTDANDVEIATADPVSPYVPTSPASPNFIVLQTTIGNGTDVPGTGLADITYTPVEITITGWVIQALVAASIQFDIWAAPFVVGSNPTISDSIVASAPPTLTSAVSAEGTVLTGWTTVIAAGSAIAFNVNSVALGAHYTLTLFGTTS